MSNINCKQNTIMSNSNKIIKLANALKTKKQRDETGLFIIEGEKYVAEIPDSWNVEKLLVSESYNLNCSFNQWDKIIVNDNIFKTISDTKTPQGVLAICQQKNYNIEQLKDFENAFYVIAEEINDPGNLGTVIRTADAVGASGVIFTKGCVDIYNPKVLRSTAGSIFHLPLYCDVDLIELFKLFNSMGIITLGTHLKSKLYPYSLNLKVPCAIFIGNEAHGLSESTSKLCDYLVKIPMTGKAESLNASVACGVLLYEVVRQRLLEEKQ